MKIVNRETLMALPAKTFYRQYEQATHQMGELLIKGTTERETETFSGDWKTFDLTDVGSSNVAWPRLDAAVTKGDDFQMVYGASGNDGEYDWDQLYVVYEEQDVRQLIEFLIGQSGLDF